MKLPHVRGLVGGCVFALAGCTVGPDFHRPNATLPARWTSDASGATSTSSVMGTGSLDPQWWGVFHDAELSSLIDRMIASNLDLGIAATRLAQARAARQVTGAEAEPALNGSLSYARARSSQNGLLDISGLGGKSDYSVWQPSLDMSWELDLWGRVRRATESADASIEVRADLRRDLLLSAIAETATNYMALRGLQAQDAIVRQNLDIARHSLKLTEVRLSDGVATQLEVAEAAAQVSSIEAQLPMLENQRVRLVNALSYLLAQPPRALEGELRDASPIPMVPALVPMGLPSELAERRPDIREAEARLHGATADIGVAVGDFYPSITLSADVGLQSMQAGDLDRWSSRMFGVGPAISVPIFEGGRLKGQLALRKAQQQEAMIQFQQTVLKAWHEIDGVMSDYETRQLRRDKLAVTVEQDRIALESVRRQYTSGATDFLNVLLVQKDLLAAQEALVSSSTGVSVSLVNLYKALGGGWEATYPAGSSTPPMATTLSQSRLLSARDPAASSIHSPAETTHEP